jgi:hypothetical protein
MSSAVSKMAEVSATRRLRSEIAERAETGLCIASLDGAPRGHTPIDAVTAYWIRLILNLMQCEIDSGEQAMRPRKSSQPAEEEFDNGEKLTNLASAIEYLRIEAIRLNLVRVATALNRVLIILNRENEK